MTTNGAGAGRLVVLTGATGFLGSHLAEALLGDGWRVRAACRAASDRRWLADRSIEWRVSDLHSADDCRALLQGAHTVIHCAGVVSALRESDYRHGNVDTTANLIGSAAFTLPGDGAFILVSSLAAHGPAGLDRPAVESDPCRPITAYGRSKLATEELVVGQGWPFRTAAVRPPALCGPRDRAFLPLLHYAYRGWTARLGRRMTGLSLLDGRDAAAAVAAVARTPSAQGVYFAEDGRKGYSWDDLNAALARAVERPVRTVTVPLQALRLVGRLGGGWRPGRPSVFGPDRLLDLDTDGWVCDGSLLTAATGFVAARDAATSFADALLFYRKAGWL
jgi:nucleoside-diphosphate-sugar epimerase